MWMLKTTHDGTIARLDFKYTCYVYVGHPKFTLKKNPIMPWAWMNLNSPHVDRASSLIQCIPLSVNVIKGRMNSKIHALFPFLWVRNLRERDVEMSWTDHFKQHPGLIVSFKPVPLDIYVCMCRLKPTFNLHNAYHKRAVQVTKICLYHYPLRESHKYGYSVK